MPIYSRTMGRQNGGQMRPMGRMPKDILEGVSSAGHAQLTRGRRMGRVSAPTEVVNGLGNLFYKWVNKGKPVPQELHPKTPTTLISRDHAGRPIGHHNAHAQSVASHNENFGSGETLNQGFNIINKKRTLGKGGIHYY